MSNYSPVYKNIWSDIKFTEYSPEQQLIFLYLITNKNCKVSGIYQLSPKEVAYSTNLDKNTVIDSLKAFDEETLEYDAAAGVVFLKNHFKYNMNQIGNPKVMLSSLINNSKLVSHPTFWDDFIAKYEKNLGALAQKVTGLKGNDSTLSQHLANTYPTLSQDLCRGRSRSRSRNNTINDNKINNSNTVQEKKSELKRNFSEFHLQVAKQLGEHVKSIKKVNLKVGDIKRWANDIRLLEERDLKSRKDAKESIQKVMKAIIDNTGREYFPEVESGVSFRSKFVRIESFLKRDQKPKEAQERQLTAMEKAAIKFEGDLHDTSRT